MLFPNRYLAAFCLIALQWSAVQPVLAQHTYPATGASPTDLPITASQLVSSNAIPVRSGLDAFDKAPLGNRTPLILVHGIGASASTQFNWERFLDYADKQKPLMERYKIYLYHYDSTRSVPDISQSLLQTLKHFIQAQNGRHIKILAYSEGGLLTRNAMQDSYVDAHTDEVITLATPFHGSPLANPEWIRQQVKTDSPFSLVRIGQRIAYSITGKLYPTFKEDFHWDNFDGALPASQYKGKGAGETDYALARKEKFVTYGSYFGLELNPAIVPEALDVSAELPKERLILANMFRRNALFSLVRKNIGKLPVAVIVNHHNAAPTTNQNEPLTGHVVQEVLIEVEQQHKAPELMLALADQDAESVNPDLPDGPVTLELEPEEKAQLKASTDEGTLPAPDRKNTQLAPKIKITPVSMMMFNDGISPISSTLWLGRYMPHNANGATVSVEKLWATLKKLKGNDNTRLFAGVDHRNWMDGTTRTGEAKIQDLLNPDEPPRTIFAWLVYDLMS